MRPTISWTWLVKRWSAPTTSLPLTQTTWDHNVNCRYKKQEKKYEMILWIKELTFRHVCSSWHSDLHKHNFLPPFRILFQEHLECQKFLRNSFYHVESIHTQHHLIRKKAGNVRRDRNTYEIINDGKKANTDTYYALGEEVDDLKH